ncbi:MAG: PAS domain S-box protein, partial [Bacteroidota bacterium]|nr:PAS domain S-box protein [Bacteroidota bacterium]
MMNRNVPTYDELKEQNEQLREQLDLIEKGNDSYKYSNENLCEALKSIDIAFIAVDEGGDISFMNSIAEKLTGCELEVSQGKQISKVFEINNSGTSEPISSLIGQVLLTGKTEDKAKQAVLIAREGAGIHITYSVSPIRGTTGKIKGAVLVFRDISLEYKIQKELKESNERFKRLFNDLGDAVFVAKIGGKDWGQILETNPAAEIQTGYTQNELAGMNIAKDIAVQESGDFIHAMWDNKLLEGEAIRVTEIKKRKDGSQYWSEVVVTPIIYKGDKACLSINRDITEQIKATEALKKSEDKYKSIINNMIDGYYRTDKEGNVIFISPSAIEITGYDESCFGKQLSTLYTNPIDREAFLIEIKKTGRVQNYLIEFRKKDGSNIFVETNSRIYYDENNDFAGVEGTFRDVTQRKRTYEELQKLSKVIQTTSQAIVILDIQGIVVYVNDSLVKIMAYDNKAEVLGQSMYNFTDDEGKRKLEDEIIPDLMSTGHWQGEINNKRKDGTLFPCDERCSMIVDDNNQPTYFVAIFSDITERKKIEDSVRKSEERYRSLFENAPIGIFSVNREGRILEANASLLQILGSPSIEATKSIDILIFPPLIEAGISPAVQKCFESGKFVSAETPYKSKWGKTIVAYYRVLPNHIE